MVAALILAHATSSTATYAGRLQATSLWRAVIFILQAIAFFLVGIDVPSALRQLTPDEHRQLIVIVPAVLIALMLTRFAFVYGMNAIAGTRRSTGGAGSCWLRGNPRSISALAAFTLPLTTVDGSPFPGRDMIISITFCVVLASLLLAPTIKPLVRWVTCRPTTITAPFSGSGWRWPGIVGSTRRDDPGRRPRGGPHCRPRRWMRCARMWTFDSTGS